MIFSETTLNGAFILEINPTIDERGFFSRTWCKREFDERALNSDLVQCNVSHNIKKGTLRGMHFQRAPYEEAKLVSCTKGSIYDVIIDLRSDSLTYKQWISIILSQENKKMLYIPEGFAHGFITLEDYTTVFYQMSEYYYPLYSNGIRYNDPSFNIEWPVFEELVISEKDMSYEDFTL